MATDYLIAGATGLVGGEILKQIIDANTGGNIFVLGRRAPDLTHARIQFVSSDFSNEPQWGATKPVNPIAICTLGTTIKTAGSKEAFRRVDFDFVVGFAQIAHRAGATSLHVVTAHGASADSAIFYNRVKGEVEAKLQAMGLPAVHIYRPSLLIGDRKEHRSGEGVAIFAAKILGPIFKLPGLNAIEPTPAVHLAKFILDTAAKPAPGNHIHSNADIMKS